MANWRYNSAALEEHSELLDLVSDTIVVREMSGAIRYWNKAAERLYGFSKNEALGQNYHELLKTEFPKPLADIEQEVLADGSWDGELTHISRDGSVVFVMSRWSATLDETGGQPSFFEIDSDMSERKTAARIGLRALEDRATRDEERLIEMAISEKLLQSKSLELKNADHQRQLRVEERSVELAASDKLLQSKLADIELADQQRELRVEERAVEIASSNKLMRLKVSEAETADDERELRVKERIIELAASEKLLQSKLLEIEIADRHRELRVQERVVELAASEKLLQSKLHEIEVADKQRELRVEERVVELAASEKLLQSKLQEIEVAEMERELRVKERIVELAASEQVLGSKVKELEDSNEELQQFAYVCSHDLQEPLRVISNYTQLLAKRYQGQLDEKADKFIGFTVDAAKRMQDLINALLEYSRLQRNEIRSTSVDCSLVVEMALANLRIVIEETGATVTYDPLPKVEGDVTQLLQIFQNLIGNAIRFRSQAAPCVNITTKREGDLWLFKLRDNGIGIDMQFAERIFLIFQRLHAREDYPGSGIGLAICKKIVIRNGGTIWIESEPDKGTTFLFTLPAASPEHQHD
jgi:PAS domain S-box-containing protein